MSMALKGDVKIKCSNCGTEITISENDFEHNVSREEKNMGPEKDHKFIWEDKCYNCGNEIKIEISGCEYPECVHKSEDKKIEGAEFLEEPGLKAVHAR